MAILRRDIDPFLPEHLAPVPHRIPEPQFFPGATGLLPYEEWAEVRPCSTGDRGLLPPVPESPVVVLGNFFATSDEFVDVDEGRLTHLGRTWDTMREMFQGIVPPSEVFLTDSYPTLPKAGGRTGGVRPGRRYGGACRRFLVEEVRMLRPRAVLCLGGHATRLLASVCPELAQWRDSSFKAIDEAEAPVVDVSLSGVDFRATALTHPSARPVTRRTRTFRGETDLDAERAMIAEAVRT